MEFRDLKRQYEVLKSEINPAIEKVLLNANFISGKQVTELEEQLARYVGVKYCITCANGTDALSLALMAWGVGEGDAVFVPDFTFFASGETASFEGATPIFVDVCEDTFNMDPDSLEKAIEAVKKEGKLTPKVVVAVDLFGLPADYDRIRPIVEANGLLLLEDGAQGFGGEINGRKACSFGDISTTSFFPAKPLGCYGDGGAIFTNDDEVAALIKSLRIHGKGEDKYDNVRIGMNSRLDTVQAAVLQIKLDAFEKYELADVNKAAERYTKLLEGVVKTPVTPANFLSSWAQYTLILDSEEVRNDLQKKLKEQGIPTMVYYPKPMHLQKAFDCAESELVDLQVTEKLCKCVLSLPMHPYLSEEDQVMVANAVKSIVC